MLMLKKESLCHAGNSRRQRKCVKLVHFPSGTNLIGANNRDQIKLVFGSAECKTLQGTGNRCGIDVPVEYPAPTALPVVASLRDDYRDASRKFFEYAQKFFLGFIVPRTRNYMRPNFFIVGTRLFSAPHTPSFSLTSNFQQKGVYLCF